MNTPVMSIPTINLFVSLPEDRFGFFIAKKLLLQRGGPFILHRFRL